jgi:SAM-dependent methyltransferase
VSPDLEHSSGPGGQALANDYDSVAEAYAAANESSLLNGYYARPAVLDLAGDAAGRRILHVGCGAGPVLAALRDRGAVVCLVLHYLEDWSAPLAELRRVLAPGGRLIVVVNHPSTTSCRLPDRRRQRTASRARHPRALPLGLQGLALGDRLPLLPVLRPRGRLVQQRATTGRT